MLTAAQLKALVRKSASGNAAKAQVIVRSYIMERFLERLSLSPYHDRFILKGGMLISAMVGLDARATMDIDATVRGLSLNPPNVEKIVKEIAAISLDDGVAFEFKSIGNIMDEAEYGGLRVAMEATLEQMRTPLKLDISTGDAIVPKEIDYAFRLMFEERTIDILAFPIETVLAQKLETLLARGTANTRMRDFYDIYLLQDRLTSGASFADAFRKTVEKRGSVAVVQSAAATLDTVEASPEMQKLWADYQRKYSYAAGLAWGEVMAAVRSLFQQADYVE
jgi:predicted nucleotidyltransferase component of viral defense system